MVPSSGAPLKGFHARIIQHQIDDLNGILYTDIATELFPFSESNLSKIVFIIYNQYARVCMTKPDEIIKKLQLVRHPEGGWYCETWRAETLHGSRSSASLIYFLLENQQRSHWHRVDAAEIWLWHAGHPVDLEVADGAGNITRFSLGADILQHEMPQFIIQPGHWQSATASKGWALVSCVVSPAFEFEGFELAPDSWSPEKL